jgi:GNAT superfamily N-acetyltransferase
LTLLGYLSAVEIVPAKPADIDTVLGILNEATSWLLEHGMPTPWVPGKFSRPTFQDQISKNEVYLATSKTVPVGTFVLQWSDPTFWGDRPQDAGYVHKFAVKPEHHGKGIGHSILRWAMARTRKAGKKFLRLNCVAEDRGIRDYYEKAGFSYRGDVNGPVCLASLYELEL